MDFPTTTIDPHYFDRSEESYVKHMDLELYVNFRDNILEGRAILTIKRQKPSISLVMLNRLGLDVTSVTNMDNNQPLFILQFDTTLGNPINVLLPQVVGPIYNPEYKLQIEYKTISTSPALYWLTPAQTADGLHPFLLSNNKLMYARTWFPCQNTRTVKFTYTAKIVVPKTFTVLMSASLLQIVYDVVPEYDGYVFCQDKSVPSYAINIAVGVLEKEELNIRSSLYAETKYFTSACQRFRLCINTIEYMLGAAESLCGPYVWGRCDICVLPPSVADFEMECPCVIFISPDCFPSDHSYMNLFAERILKNWAGYLVTCYSFEHLWLNKSFSTFISRKITSKLLEQIENISNFFKRKGRIQMKKMIEASTNDVCSKCLIPSLGGLFSVIEATKYVPYERGCMLLEELENMLGGPSVFELFFKSYFNAFEFKCISTNDWIRYLYEYFPDKKVIQDTPWSMWLLDEPPLPIMPEVTAWEIKYFTLADEWIKWDGQTHNIPDALRDGNINLHLERLFFLDCLHMLYPLYVKLMTEEKLKLILECYKFEDLENSIRFSWLLLCIKIRWADKFYSALNFAIEFCSPSNAYPIFKELYEWKEMRGQTIEVYKSNKGKMLYETQKGLNEILHLKS